MSMLHNLLRAVLRSWPTILPILAGIFILGMMLAQARPGYFYSVDGGLKYLMIQQYLNGNISASLPAAQSQLQQDLWNAGHYPYTPPYVFAHGSSHIPAFPLYFPLLTTPFVKFFGFYGLHVLPALALISVWILMALAARRHRFGQWPVFLGMLAITIASPLTIYGALFWEHSLAALFAAIPITILMAGRQETQPKAAIMCGIATGLSAFFRPEMLPFLPILVVSAAFTRGQPARRHFMFLGTGVAISFLAFFTTNTAVYAHPLGSHVLNIVGEDRITVSFWASLMDRTPSLFRLFVKHVPFGLAFLLFAVLPAFSQNQKIRFLALSLSLSLVGIALIVPNNGGLQWGPRYYIPLVPWFSYGLMSMISELSRIKSSFLKFIVLLTCISNLCWCINENTRNAFYHLQRYNHFGYGPTVRFLGEAREKHFLFPDSCSANWAYLTPNKDFYRCWSANDVNHVVQQLHHHGVKSCLYVSFHLAPPPHPGYEAEPLQHVGSEVVIYRLRSRTISP